MHWKVKQLPRVGDRRLLTFFAWIPYRFGDECFWLEWVTIEEELYQQELPTKFGFNITKDVWMPYRLIKTIEEF